MKWVSCVELIAAGQSLALTFGLKGKDVSRFDTRSESECGKNEYVI